MPSLNKRSIEAIGECVQAFKKLRETSDDAPALSVVGEIFHQKLFPTPDSASLHTINNHYSKLRKELGNEFPTLRGSTILPKMPKELSDQRKENEIEAVNKHILSPMTIDADLMINKALSGLREGLRDRVYPEVKLCLSFLCCLRSNDLNTLVVRSNGQAPKLGETHHWLDTFPGTFSMLPSKQKEGTDYKAFANITIVKPEFYSLIRKAFEFLLDHQNAKKACYCTLESYNTRKECGAQTKNCEWGYRIKEVMIDRIGFKQAVTNWNGWEDKEFINETFGRRFVACCVHREIIKFADDLNVGTLAADYCLGHVLGSSATRTYLRYSLRPTQIPGVVLKKVQEDNPIAISEDTKITQGLYLEQTL